MLLRPVALITAALLLSSCSSSFSGESASVTGDPVVVASGFYPYAFLAERIGGADVRVVNLTEPGAEPHDLELSPRQVAELAETDLVLYSPGFQPAVDEAVEQHAGDSALDVLGVVELRAAAEHDDEHGDEHGDGHEEGAGDPHIWLDPLRFAAVSRAIASRLSEADPQRARAFTGRADALEADLTALDEQWREGLRSCARTTIVTNHDAFGYLADAYGLEQVPLAGLSPDDEASPRRLAEVASFARETGVTTIFFEEVVSPKVAESLAREVGAAAAQLNVLEITPADGDYLTGMQDNLTALRTALDCA